MTRPAFSLLPLALLTLNRSSREISLRTKLSGLVNGFAVVLGDREAGARPKWRSAPFRCPDELTQDDIVWIGIKPAKGRAVWTETPLRALEDATPTRLSVSLVKPVLARGSLLIAGWMTTALPRFRIEVNCNGTRVANLRHGLPRRDVHGKNNLLPETSGFKGQVELSEAQLEQVFAGEARFDLRIMAPGVGAAFLKKLELPEGTDLEQQSKLHHARRKIAEKVERVPRWRLEWLLASSAFRRRWSASESSLAWLARELIVGALIPLLKKGDEIAVRLRNGDRVLCQPVDDSILARKFLIDAGDEMGFLEWLSGQTGPGDAVLDVGAAYGMVSRAMARQGANVIAIEADPTSASRIRRSGLDFGEGRIELVEMAVSDRPGEVTFAAMGDSCAGVGKILDSDEKGSVESFLSEISELNQIPLSAQVDPGAHRRRVFRRQDVNILHVVATTIDDICASRQLRDVALVKIDIEGGELQALRGAAGLLGGAFGRPPVVVFEYSRLFPMRGGAHEEVLDIFLDKGWSLYRLARGKSKGGDLQRIPDKDAAPHHDNLIAVPPAG